MLAIIIDPDLIDRVDPQRLFAMLRDGQVAAANQMPGVSVQHIDVDAAREPLPLKPCQMPVDHLEPHPPAAPPGVDHDDDEDDIPF